MTFNYPSFELYSATPRLLLGTLPSTTFNWQVQAMSVISGSPLTPLTSPLNIIIQHECLGVNVHNPLSVSIAYTIGDPKLPNTLSLYTIDRPTKMSSCVAF
jgi:hypothetical protein